MKDQSVSGLAESYNAHKDLIGATFVAAQLPSLDNQAATLVFEKGFSTITNVYRSGIGAGFNPDLFLNERISKVDLLKDRVRITFENGQCFDNGAF